MSQDLKNKAQPRERESTLAFKQMDPGAESLAFPRTARIDALRERLSNFANVGSTDPAGLNFGVFLDHIDGVKTLAFGGIAFDLVLTEGRSIFLISDLSPEDMREAMPQAPALVFSRCSSITSLISPSLYLYRITSKELSLLQFMSDLTERQDVDDPDIPINIKDLKMKLKGSHVLHSEPGFDLQAFADSITEASGFCDKKGNAMIVLPGSEDSAYTIYVNADQAEIFPSSQQICRFLNSGKVCILCKEEVLYWSVQKWKSKALYIVCS